MQSTTLMNFCETLASLKLTLVALSCFAASVVIAYAVETHTSTLLALPLALLAINLLATILTNKLFRQSGALLVFHVALLALVVLIALGRLTYMKGHLELSQGEEFSGRLIEVEAGPWHPSSLSEVHFSNEGFSIGYAPGLLRERTRNAVRFIDENGIERYGEIGDQNPLVLHGYRFYTSPNKGFAPTFLWHPASGGEPILGSVHLPSYPANAYRQAREWQLPGTGLMVWTMLQFDETILDPEKPSQFRFPENYTVVVRAGDLRQELKLGDALELPQGRLVFQGLRSWMGYTVFYDWTIQWLLATSLVAVAALCWYFWSKFSGIPWDRTA